MVRTPVKAVVFDLFNTLVRWEPERLPLLEVNGRRYRSTLPPVLAYLQGQLGAAFDRDRFVAVYHAVMAEIQAERASHGIEVLCCERFERAVTRCALKPAGEAARRLAVSLTKVHMAQVRAVTYAPPAWASAVRALASRYRLGLLSNFDDAETGRLVVADTGVADLFAQVVISAEVGLRKPNPAIFRLMLERLGLEAASVLFVGDTPAEDVAGAKGVMMPCAWVNCRDEPFPQGLPKPDLVVADLAALAELLGCPA